MFRDDIQNEVAAFRCDTAEQEADIAFLLSQDPALDLSSRKTLPIHVTASGIVLDTNDPAVLLVRHAVLKKWVFPGGHLDPGETIVDAAVREILEETGLVVSPDRAILYDVDVHNIPANPKKDEPGHLHADFRYLFSSPVDRRTLWISPESTGFIWAANDEEIADHWKGRKVLRDKIVHDLNGWQFF